MNPLITLIDNINNEDALLRSDIARVPKGAREIRGEGDSLSFKETLGHIGFWDDYTVQFFWSQIDHTRRALAAPVDFEAENEAALGQTRRLPFGEVLARYLESTGAMVDFLKAHWADLTPRERHGFLIPLEHRRQHRISLEASLGLTEGVELDSVADGLAAEA